MASSKQLACLALLALAATALVAAQDSPQEFVDLHNAAREAEGVGLDPVVWDNRVAAYAQSYAAQRQDDCTLIHSSGPYGENLLAGPPGATVSAAIAVSMWMDEKQWYDYDTNSCFAPAGFDCGHYTQVVWSKSTAIGCARVDCNNGGAFLICSYDPPGNFPGERPYEPTTRTM